MNSMPLDQLLASWSLYLAQFIGGVSLTPLETNELRDMLRRCHAELDRLSRDLATRTAERDTLTDEIFRAGFRRP